MGDFLFGELNGVSMFVHGARCETDLVDDRIVASRSIIPHAVKDVETSLGFGIDSVEQLVVPLNGTVRFAYADVRRSGSKSH